MGSRPYERAGPDDRPKRDRVGRFENDDEVGVYIQKKQE
jgi:hypothetical protein